jgi:hypothetical protein
MRGTPSRPRSLVLASGAAVLTIGAGVARTDTVAINVGATYVTPTSEMLNGVVNVTDPASSLQFEYATSQDFSSSPQFTSPGALGAGTTVVSATITGLTPGQTYYFRLVVLQFQGSYNAQTSTSDTLSFVAGPPSGVGGGGGSAPPGTGSLATTKLKVTKGEVAIPIECKGSTEAVCTGTVSITARGRLPHHKHASTVKCGGGSFSATAGNADVVHGALAKGCKTLLTHARHHTLRGTLRVTFTSKQAALTASVTLTG